ncbi:MAG: S41 family peptidase [Tannerella sp.]|jgi:carboxyl-terminal processing protease|nr:S41 family peptidase [Tannerella sp.]
MKKYKGVLKHKWLLALGLSILVIVGFVAANNDKKNFEVVKNLDIFYSLFRELNGYYVDETDPEKLIKTGIDAMLESLDPYTTLIPESEIEGFRFMTTGEYAGIGALITKRDNYVVISEPYEGFPAQEAGLKAGDKILEIDGESMAGMEISQVSDKLKGAAQTQLKVKIERRGTKGTLEIPITRRVIQINAVPYYGMLNAETGIIILSNFTSDCYMEVEKAFNDLKNNSGMKNVILDMRGNPGGLLDEAVKVAGLFLPRGSEVVGTRGKVSQWDKTYRTPREPIDMEMPMAILISRGSASASEIVAGAMQDYDRALIIGQRSFGKGLVQTTRNLSYNAKLKVTTAKYYIPSGRCIQAVDYSHRNEDGSVGYIPDSLIREFRTKGGRKVFDGGGISPDVTVPTDKYSNLTFALIMQQTIFDYATDYVIKHPAIDVPLSFKLSDNDYNGLKQYVASLTDFKYQSESQENLKKLVETAKHEGYYDDVSETFASLEKDLAPNVEKDMDIFKDEVSELFTLELMRRYYYQKGAILYSLKDDKDVAQAVETLAKHDEYAGMLNGTILTHAGDKREVNQK